MKKIILISLLMAGCTKGTGTFRGKVIDVSWEGLFFKTCEVDVQYGEQSSQIEKFSSEFQKDCDYLEANLNKVVLIKYAQTAFECFTCRSSDLIIGLGN